MSAEVSRDSDSQLLERGRREGYALAALVLSLVSFVNLLGAEKSLLAIVLAAAALRGGSYPTVKRKGWIAIAIASLHVATIVLVLVLFHDRFAELLELLRRLG